MILVDSSIWIDHLRRSNAVLLDLILGEEVLCHSFIIGELAVGSIKDRVSFLGRLSLLPKAILARDDEVLRLIEEAQLFGHGIGYIDAHLLASVRLTDNSRLWTFDRRLHTLATRDGTAASLPRRIPN